MKSLDLIPAGVIICDIDARIKTLNATMRDWMGEAANDLIGQPLHSLFAPAGKIYFETHIRPMLMVEGEINEISMQLQGPIRPRRRIYLNGRIGRSDDGTPTSLQFACFDGTQRFGYEQELLAKRRVAESYEALVTASPDAIMTVDPENRITGWNRAAEGLFGYTAEEMMGQDVRAQIATETSFVSVSHVLRALTKDPTFRSETDYRHKDGSLIPVEVHSARVDDEFDHVTGVISIIRDIRERREAETTVRILSQEVIHRSKNQISVVMAIARSTARYSDPDKFNEVFSDRLQALSRNMSLLLDRGDGHLSVRALVEAQLSHLGLQTNHKILMEGEDVTLPKGIAEPLGLALFELSTNAVKYGALSDNAGPDSRLSLAWNLTGKGLSFTWTESGMTGVTEPSSAGFGSQLTGKLLQASTRGNVDVDFTSTGLRWVFTVSTDPNALLT